VHIFRTLLILAVSSLLLVACAKKTPDPTADIPPDLVNKALRDFTQRWDLDGDGKATCGDIALLRERQFMRLDSNRDGRLSPLEYRAINFEDNSFVFFEFKTVDIDQTASIELAEFSAVSHSLFRGTDKDNDCVIGYRDAAFIVLNNRRNGIGARERAEGEDPRRRRKGDEIDPFE